MISSHSTIAVRVLYSYNSVLCLPKVKDNVYMYVYSVPVPVCLLFGPCHYCNSNPYLPIPELYIAVPGMVAVVVLVALSVS